MHIMVLIYIQGSRLNFNRSLDPYLLGPGSIRRKLMMCAKSQKGRIMLSRFESEIVLHRLGFYVFGSQYCIYFGRFWKR